MRARATVMSIAAVVAIGSGCGSDSATRTTSPLEAIFGGNESPAESRAKQLAAEEQTSVCMKDLGWEYIPVDYSAQFNDAAEELDYSDPDFGKKYGYGMVKSYELYELPYLLEGDDGGGGGQQFVDPNQDYVASLTSDEMEQYYADLNGDPEDQQSMIDEGTGETVYLPPPPEQSGCQGKAQAEVYGDQPFNDQDFNERFSELSQDMENDPRLQDAYIEWSDCVYELDQNLDFLEPNEVFNYFSMKMAEAKGQRVLPLDPATGEPIGEFDQTEGWGSTVNADGTGWAYVGEGEPIDNETLAALQEEEIALWKVDDQCQSSVGLKELRQRMEQELVDTIIQEFPDLVGES